MSPTIVENPDGTLHLAIGAAGGSRIITATIQNIIHVLDEGLSPCTSSPPLLPVFPS